ncbi:hypothetical protein LCGC14_2279580, partial [marine sediment metagenome]
WGGYGRFWEQVLRWAGKAGQGGDCEVYADIRNRDVTLTVDAVDSAGKFVQFADLTGRVITPTFEKNDLQLTQIGPGRYRAGFRAGVPGSYLVHLRYRKAGGEAGTVQMVQTVVTVPYAPEYRDLSDNEALMRSVAAATGGRVLTNDPEQSVLFERAGVNFPHTAIPITKHLLIVWLVLFLLDVAIRRIAVDFVALWRRAVAWVKSLFGRTAAAEETVDRLKERTRRLRKEMSIKSADPLASHRYKGATEDTRPLDMPSPVAPAEPDKPEREPSAPAKDAKGEQPEHLQRLLRAKRQAKGRMDKKD